MRSFCLFFALACAIHSSADAGFIFYADEVTDSIRRADLNGSNVTTIISGQVAARGVAIDAGASKIYWTDGHAFPRSIQRANLDGSAVETIFSTTSGTLNTIALDLVNNKVYFANSISGLIQRANLDGTGLETIASGADEPVGIAVDSIRGKVYWSGGAGGIGTTYRANLDGTGVEQILSFGARDLEIDLINEKLYLGGVNETSGQTIRISELDGSGVQTLLSTTGFSQMGVDFTIGKIYWSDLILDKILRSNLDGSNTEQIITSGLSTPRDIAFFNPVPEPSAVVLFLTGAFVLIVYGLWVR